MILNVIKSGVLVGLYMDLVTKIDVFGENPYYLLMYMVGLLLINILYLSLQFLIWLDSDKKYIGVLLVTVSYVYFIALYLYKYFIL